MKMKKMQMKKQMNLKRKMKTTDFTDDTDFE